MIGVETPLLPPRREPRKTRVIATEPAEPAPPAATPLRARRSVPRRAPRPRAPLLADVPVPEPKGLLDRLLPDEARQRLAALEQLVPPGPGYDAFGLSATALRQAFPYFYALYRGYFRVESVGHENLPSEGPVVLAANHGGLLPFDGAMGVLDIAMNTDPPRLARTIVDRWAGTLPFVNVFFARAGQVVGTRENFTALLDHGHPVLVFPEGVEGIRKPIAQRYRLQKFHTGFVVEALRAKAPVVPMAILGSDDQAPILYDVKPLARWLGIPAAPITPTFPLFGPLGLLPYPVRYRIVYGKPLGFLNRYGPEAASDPHLVRFLAHQVRRSIQILIDRNR